MKTWRVTSQDTQEGLTRWADGLDEAFVRLQACPTCESGFNGQIRQVSTGALDVSLVTCTGHEIRRLDEHIRSRAPDVAFVNILSRGRSKVTQGRSFEAAPMDLSIVDTRQPYAIRQDEAFQLVSLAVPTGWIGAGTAAYHPLGRSAAGRELSGIIWGLAQMLLRSGSHAGGMTPVLTEQLRHCLTLLPRMAQEMPERRATVDLLQSYVERHLDQPDLRAETLARHFGVSVRRVHQLFEPTGQSVSAFINEVRLTRAAALLEAGGKGTLVADVAWQVGYADPSYFIRRFRRRFGCTPRGYARDGGRGRPLRDSPEIPALRS